MILITAKRMLFAFFVPVIAMFANSVGTTEVRAKAISIPEMLTWNTFPISGVVFVIKAF